MKSADIVNQLVAVLPEHVDFFTNESEITAGTFDTGTATVTLTVDTGALKPLMPTQAVTLVGVYGTLPVVTLTASGTAAELITSEPHQLTEGQKVEFEVIGANESVFNGVHTATRVPNRYTIRFDLPAPFTGTATGAITLNDYTSRGFGGTRNVSVNYSGGTISYLNDYTDPPATFTFDGAVVRGNYRISATGTNDIERLNEAYTNQGQNEYWLFVALGPVAAGKDRHEMGDATKVGTRNADVRQRLIERFSVFVFAPVTKTIAARQVRDTMQDVRIALFKSLLRKQFDNGLDNNFGVVFLGDDYADYNTSNYVHQFDFEQSADLVFEDTINVESVAFRNFNLILEFDLADVTAD